MKRAEIEMCFTTPAFLAGADQKTAELRAPSIRGQLRWWARALGIDSKVIDELFGCIGSENSCKRSKVVIQTKKLDKKYIKNYNTFGHKEEIKRLEGGNNYFLWPFCTKDGSNYRGYIEPGTETSFNILLRNDESSEVLERVLKAFLLLGSLGSRSRKSYGSVWPLDVCIDDDCEYWIPPQEMCHVKEDSKKILADTKISVYRLGNSGFKRWQDAVAAAAGYLKKWRCGSTKSGTPQEWGQNDHDAGFGKSDVLYRPVLGLPLTQRYSKNGSWETKVSGCDRFASPVHFKVIRLDDEGFVPLVIFFENDVRKFLEKNPRADIKQKNGGGRHTLKLSRELFDKMKEDENLRRIY